MSTTPTPKVKLSLEQFLERVKRAYTFVTGIKDFTILISFDEQTSEPIYEVTAPRHTLPDSFETISKAMFWHELMRETFTEGQLKNEVAIVEADNLRIDPSAKFE